MAEGVTSAAVVQGGGVMEEEKKEVKQGRPYQVELVEYALRENTIVSLGTGAGKTFVAVMLIREMSHMTSEKFTEETGQRTIFLAHTVPLVKQQANYIRENTNLTVSDFCGDAKNVDSWSKKTWYDHFNNNNVLVFSRAIFLDLLLKAFIKPRQLNLIVFDECHHATKNDPFVQIMKVIKDAPEEQRPRILGLSASLLGRKVKPGELEKGVRALETVLMSTARTTRDLSDMVKYATNPDEKICNFSSSVDEVAASLKCILDPTLDFLRTKVDKRQVKSPIEETARNLLDDLQSILVDLGPASAAGFVGQAIRELKNTMKFSKPEDQWDNLLGCLVLSQLTIFETKLYEFKHQYGKLQDSNKVHAMFLQIADMAVRSGEMDITEDTSSELKSKKEVKNLRGIIFVERRHTASCLSKLIQEKSRSDPDLQHISCDYVVGHNVGQNSTTLKKEARMKSKEQEKVLCKFRRGKINLLVATSVIEEGVDVPKCNLVIRFDMPQNFRSYAQSKGRARDKPSTFLLLIGDNQLNSLMDIENYHHLEKELIVLCQEDRKLPSEEEIQAKMADKIPPYMPFGPEGARVTTGNSLTLLHRYCQRLPCDEFTVLVPSFKVRKIPKDNPGNLGEVIYTEDEDEDHNFNYICSLSLPFNCPIKEIIESPPMGSKLQSHRAAAIFAIEELHKLKELDDIFKPTPLPDSDDEDVREEKKIPLAGTEKRSQLYKNEVATVLSSCYPQEQSPDNFLYVFVIREKDSGILYQSQVEVESSKGLGILLKKRLPHWKIPEYSLYVKESGINKELIVTLQQFPITAEFASEDLSVLQSSHISMFSNILRVQPPELTANFEHSQKDYIVVPVTINRMDGNEIKEVAIDYNIARAINDILEIQKFPDPPYSAEKFKNSLISVRHRDSISHSGLLELYKPRLDPSLSPLSTFPDSKFANFLEYYNNKYNYELKDLEQPGLICTRVSMSFLKVFTSRYTQDVFMSKKNTPITLFPELVQIYPLSASFWKLLRCLPACLWRLESLTHAEDLSGTVMLDTGIGRLHYDTILFTDTVVKGYVDAGFGDIPSKTFKVKGDVIPESINDMPSQLDNRGPDNGLILQALTPKGANDSIDLERLESLGDSLLKLCTSIYLFNTRTLAHEGKLSEARARRVSNVNLFCLAKKKGIATKIFANDFVMGGDSSSGFDRIRWIPPGFVIAGESLPQGPSPLEERYHYHRVTDKGVADVAEALIGAYTVAGGLQGGIAFMKWLGVKLDMPPDIATSTAEPFEIKDSKRSLLFVNSSAIFKSYFGEPKPPRFIPKNVEDINRMISQTANVQQRINYQFKNHLLLIEALTHPSYARNNITDCYQRLEFLGDAILDYVVTCQIYQSDASSTPGEITELRSAIVCNQRFAELAVDLNLHRSMLHSSPDLFKKMGKYAIALKERQEGEIQVGLQNLYTSEEDNISVRVDSLTGEDLVCDDDNIDEDEDNELLDPPKSLSDVFEAIVGAVFVDSGMSLEIVWKTFEPILKPLLEKFKDNIPVPAIKELYEKIPTGLIFKREILYSRKCRCVIEVKGHNIRVYADAMSYRNAKNAAAKKVLTQLSQN